MLIIVTLLMANGVKSQHVLVDCRDSTAYDVVDIGGTLWMKEDLKYKSELSRSLTGDYADKYPHLRGRFYHINELDSVCPCDWKLPDVEDWIAFYDHLATINSDSLQIKLSFDKAAIAIMNYHSTIDVFSDDNPLNLRTNGRMEGEQYFYLEGLADYWVKDPPDFSEGTRNLRPGVVHVLPQVFSGKTHIHIRSQGLSNIHSHNHHLDPKKEKKLRKFMVRCIKPKDGTDSMQADVPD